MDEFVELEDFLNRSNWILRAAITRFLIFSDDSPMVVLDDSPRKSTRGSSYHHFHRVWPYCFCDLTS